MVCLKSRPILVDGTLQELTEHGNDSFAMSMDEQHVNAEDFEGVLHWHYEIQITIVVSGSVLFKTQDKEFLIHTGEGIVFNSGCLHEPVPAEEGDCAYVCVNFHPKIVYGYPESLLRHAYVDPVLFSGELQAIPLREKPWHMEICTIMRELARVDMSQTFGYEIRMYSLVLQMWYLIVHNNERLLCKSTPVSFSERQRIKALTGFIHNNYMDAISLADIAASDHISKGECCRIFKRVTGTTPFSYLVSYRIRQSIKLLAMTDLNISEIAQNVGFGSGSYFTECFKREMKCPPLAYRKKLEKSQGDSPTSVAFSAKSS
ncbi:AraC family transcriptional regulator [Synergistes jonesii]|uniref:AraC family transcriptional regulator n=1 Tax=Synergistes jonesii TaxID=2754 RepID=UPI00248EC3A5|nr:AraC family transcriptional regulator [Synergistes jonesii]